MAESSDSRSGSVQSLGLQQQVDQSSSAEAISDTDRRFYALYSFYPNRHVEDAAVTADFVDSKDGNTSLSIVATTLTASTETDLRKSLSYKLAYKTRPSGEGHFFSIGLNSTIDTSSAASCYYCVASSASDSLGFDHVTTNDQPNADDASFVSFHGELDQFTKGLIPLLDRELPVHSSACPSSSSSSLVTKAEPSQQTELSQLSMGIQTYLDRWPSAVLGFIPRSLQYLGSNTQYLIYAALLNSRIQISGGTAEQQEDISRFFKCCSLSTLLDQLQSNSLVSTTESGDSNDLWQLQPVVVSITINQSQGVTFDQMNSSQFCKNAMDKLLSQDLSNVAKIRDFLESIKLAFAHNLNKLKRFLRQAELDHYALYSALSYLKKCGCGDLLLKYVKLDAGPETQSVVSVLEKFIKEMKQSLA